VSAQLSRREFLAYGSILGWIPFLRPRHISLAGARFRIHRNGRSKRRYLLIHGNEESAREVLRYHIRSHEGIAYEVVTHTRNIQVAGGSVDPNRMFSRVGAEASLRRLNPDWTPDRIAAAQRILDAGRERLVRAFFPPPGGLTVALHNNAQGYSMEQEEADSDAGSLREPENPHAFFIATNPEDFRILANSPYNVLLQNKKPKIDDGSLSRLAAARGVRYVNLEVALGQPDRQREMLNWLEWNLP
jgi:hypothetical protein